MPDSRFHIERFTVKNFRSIRECTVDLAPLTFLIGANGSGKSNFAAALRFVPSVLVHGLSEAIENFGGVGVLLPKRSTDEVVSLEFRISTPAGLPRQFSARILLSSNRSEVIGERCMISDTQHYESGDFGSTGPLRPKDRLFLPSANLAEYQEVHEFLANVTMREPWPPTFRYIEYLIENLLHSFRQKTGTDRMERRFIRLFQDAERLGIVYQYLKAINPEFERIDVVNRDEVPKLRFVEVDSARYEKSFDSSQTSAGLGYAADILSTIFAPAANGIESPVIIEEPEAFLHPGAIQVLRDAFIEASRNRQIIVTTHSPSLLDDPGIDTDWIRVVERNEDGTHVRPLNPETRSIIKDKLYSPGQLLQQGGLI